MIELSVTTFFGVAIILVMIVVLATRKQRGRDQVEVVYIIDGDTFVWRTRASGSESAS